MEEIFEVLKSFIKNQLPEYIENLPESTCPLPLFTDSNIVFGPVDLSRYEMQTVCAILPEGQTFDDETISEWSETSRVTVAFICQKKKYDILIQQMCRYAAAFKKAVKSDYTLSSEIVEDTNLENAKFIYDAGTVENQMTVVELSMTIIINNEY